MDLNAENPFGDLMNKAVKLKGHQQAQLRTKFDAWPQYFQHSMFMQESVLSVREYDFPERITAAESMKSAGNTHFSSGDFEEAVAEYEKALAVFKYAENMDPGWKKKGIEDQDIQVTDYKCEDAHDQERLNALKISCYLNIAMSKFKLKEYPTCIHACNDVLELNPKNVKAMYRRALALITPPSSGAIEFESALVDMRTACTIDPENHEIRKLYRELREQKKRQKKIDRETFTGMFDRGQVYDVETIKNKSNPVLLDDKAREQKFQEEVAEAEYLARLCESKGQEAHAKEIREKVQQAQQIKSQRQKVDFFNPTKEMIEDGKKQGIDLTDFQVQQMLYELHQEELKKEKDPSYVPQEHTGPPATAASEEESIDSILNSMSNAQLAQLLVREGIDYHKITDRQEFLETARQVLKTKFESSSKSSPSYVKTIFMCAMVSVLVRLYSSGHLTFLFKSILNLMAGSSFPSREETTDFFDD